ncbi:MAG: flippase [Candidatus Komeilibacteria bacterium]
MELSARTISRNTGMLTGSLIVQKILSFLYFSYLATRLGVDQTGLYFFALSFITMLAVFVDWGMVNTLIKQVAKEPEKTSHYFSQALLIRVLMSGLMYLILWVLSLLLGYDLLTRQALHIAGLIMVADSFTLLCYGFLRAHHNTGFEAIGNILFQLALVIIGGLVIFYNAHILLALLALLFASLVNLGWAASRLFIKLKIIIIWQWDKALTSRIFSLALPFALAGIFSRLYGYLDTFLLKQLIGNTALGYYSLPYKITFVWQFIPLALVASLYPAFAHYYKTDRMILNKIFNQTLIYLLLLSTPIAIGLSLLANPIMVSIYGVTYQPSASALSILIFTLPFVFINFPLGYLLNACDRQKINTRNIFIAMLISLAGNLLLIPRFSYIGASIMSIISTFILFLLGLYYANKIIQWQWSVLLPRLGKLLVALGGMAGVILLTMHSWHYLLTILAASFIYLGLIIITRLVTLSEFYRLLKFFKE